MSTDLDVVIIGGGVQGLLALDTLTERGSESRTGHPARRQWGRIASVRCGSATLLVARSFPVYPATVRLSQSSHPSRALGKYAPRRGQRTECVSHVCDVWPNPRGHASRGQDLEPGSAVRPPPGETA